MDLITDLPITTRGHDSIVVFVDHLSKMMHAAECTETVSTERLAEIFEHEASHMVFHQALSLIGI
jgi:hypothetical protein